MSRALKPATALLLALTFTLAHAVDKAALKCSTGKQKAAVKKIGAKLKCHQKAAADDLAVDPNCLAKAETKFSETIAKVEAKGGCIITGDEAAIEQAADECIADIRDLTPSSPPTCGGSAFPECGGTCPPGQVCQAFIDRDTYCQQGSGQGPIESCDSVCRCVDPAVACNGQPCARMCKRTTRALDCGGTQFAEVCCGGFGAGCGSAPCCCANACFNPPFGGSPTCILSIACNASGTTEICQ